MVKEVDYVVLTSLISPEKRIYAGVMSKDKRGRGIWKTRGDVTGMVNNAFLEHFVARTKEESKKENGMVYEWFDVEGYSVKLRLKKIDLNPKPTKTLTVTYSKAKFLTKEKVDDSKSDYFVTLEEHEKLFREKDFYKKEFEKPNKPEVNKPSLSQNNKKEDGIPPTNKLVGILPKRL